MRWALARSLAAISMAFLPASPVLVSPGKRRSDPPPAPVAGRPDLPCDGLSMGHRPGTRQRQRRKLERRGGLARRKAPRR